MLIYISAILHCNLQYCNIATILLQSSVLYRRNSHNDCLHAIRQQILNVNLLCCDWLSSCDTPVAVTKSWSWLNFIRQEFLQLWQSCNYGCVSKSCYKCFEEFNGSLETIRSKNFTNWPIKKRFKAFATSRWRPYPLCDTTVTFHMTCDIACTVVDKT